MLNKTNLQELAKQIFSDSNPRGGREHIPPYMMRTVKRNSGFFFGIKRFHSHWLHEDNEYYISKPSGEDGHVLIVGGIGSGKSSCIAIQTLESWDGTFMTIDIKRELLEKARHMQRPAKVFSFSENGEGNSHYDPMYLLREGNPNDLVQNAREIAQSIIPIPPEEREKFWYESARNILMATLLYIYDLKETDEENGEIIEGDFNMAMSLIQTRTIGELLAILNKSKNKIVHNLINQFRDIDNPEESGMLQGIGAELSRHVMVFATDNRINSAFTKSDNMIRWEDLETNNIFIEIPEDKLGQWDGAIILMVTQLIRTLERRPDKNSAEEEAKKLPPVLILLDEFPRLGRIDAIQNAVSTLRSKGITICLVIQSLSQLANAYGENVSTIILDNCPYKAILNVADPGNQRLISDMIGKAEIKKTTFNESHSTSHGTNYGIGETGRFSISANSSASRTTGQSWTKMREPIIYPEELSTLKDIILLHPEGFCRIDKLPYYEHHQLHHHKRNNVLNMSIQTKNRL